MSQIDVVARLQLRAEQFSSETGARFAEMESRAASAAQSVRSSFAGAFAETQKLASQALTLPRTAGGGLDLSAEIAQLTASAAAADRNAEALRQLSLAQTAAAASGRVDAEAMRLEADAAAVGAIASERDAAAIRDRIAALQIVQSELNQSGAITVAHTKVVDRNTVSAGQQRAAMQQLGFQLNDVATSYSSGIRPMQIFAQQSGQIIQAIQMMSNKTTGLLGVLSGPWGGIVAAATIVAIPFVAKLWEGNDALEEEIAKLRRSAGEVDLARRAKERYAQTLDGVRAAIREQGAALDAAAEQERSAAERANIEAQGRLRLALSIRETTKARLADALAAQRALGDSAFANTDPRAAAAARRVRDETVAGLQQQLSDAEAAAKDAEQKINLTRVNLAAEQAERAADPIKRLNDLYAERIRLVKQEAREAAKAGAQVGAATKQRIDALIAERDAKLKAERDRQSAANKKGPSLGTQIRNEQGQRILSAAQGFNGAREGAGSLRDLFSGAGISVDPEKVAWCAAFVNAVLSGQGIKGTGSLSARSFLGYGTATDKPTQGDIVVLKRGNNAAQGHVGFYAGERNGRVLVTGGNQGDAVNTQGFSKSDVLGFRRAPTAAAEFKTNAREAAKDVRDLDAALEAVTKRFDPAAAAAADFTEVFKQIDALKTAGRITVEQADMMTFKTILAEGEARRDAQFAEWKKALGDVPDVFAGVSDYDRDQAQKWDRAGVDLVEKQMRRAEDGLRDLSDIYFDLFDSRNGSIWESFERRAMSVLADVAAQESIGLIFGGGKGGAANDNGVPGKEAVAELRKLNVSIPGLPKGFSDKLSKEILPAAGLGAVGGGAFAAITGGKSNPIASAAGGVLGEVAGKALGKAVGSSLGALGSALGPLGSIAGGILGNVVGGLLTKTQKGSSTLTFGAGGLSAGAGTGSSDDLRRAAEGSASTVVGSLSRIAEALGGKITGAGSVSIGQRDGKFVVDTAGLGRTKYGKANDGIVSFKTEEEAIRYAISDALKDGVVGGISDASRRILQAGGDLENAITKASLIEAVPRDLKAMLDPMGAAVDDLNRKFQKTVDALKEGGATAEQMAQAQQLYDLQLAQVKASTSSASASLKEFLTSLKVGSSSPLALRDQEAAALTELKPFLDKIAAGQAIDQSKYQEAARTYLDVERQLYGSTQGFFDAFEAVQASTAKAIAAIDNVTPISASVENPFAKATASAAEKTAANVQTGNEIADGQTDLLQRIAVAIEALGGGGGGAGGGFIGSGRLFTAQVA